MSHLSADSEAAILVTKRGIDNQIPINNIHIGLCIDNVWVAGCGMDIGEPKEKNTFRKYAGIVVKRPS